MALANTAALLAKWGRRVLVVDWDLEAPGIEQFFLHSPHAALVAKTPGNVTLRLELTGPNDLRIARDFTLGVRPGQAYQLKRFVARLEPGQSVTWDDGAVSE